MIAVSVWLPAKLDWRLKVFITQRNVFGWFQSTSLICHCHRSVCLTATSLFLMLLQFLKVMLCLEQERRTMKAREEIVARQLMMTRARRRGGWI